MAQVKNCIDRSHMAETCDLLVGGWKRGAFLYRSVEIPRSEPLTFGDIWSSGEVLHDDLAGGKMWCQAVILSVNSG